MITRGIYAAGLSVINDDFSLNIDATIKHGEFLIKKGLHGVFFFGSTGQSQLISVSEKKDLAAYFTLNDGSMYTFEMIGSDLAGNISDATIIDSITYDITPPIITMIYPFDDEAINNPTVSYAISEQLLLGEILWTQVDGMEDTLSPHIVNMIEDELSPEEKIRINMVNEPILMDGSIYTLTVNGRDLASNDSETIIVSNILYDTTPPSFSNIKPDLLYRSENFDWASDLGKQQLIEEYNIKIFMILI